MLLFYCPPHLENRNPILKSVGDVSAPSAAEMMPIGLPEVQWVCFFFLLPKETDQQHLRQKVLICKRTFVIY